MGPGISLTQAIPSGSTLSISTVSNQLAAVLERFSERGRLSKRHDVDAEVSCLPNPLLVRLRSTIWYLKITVWDRTDRIWHVSEG